MEKREPILLFDDVPADSTISRTFEIEQAGTIERVWLRNYIGHGFDLRYTLEIEERDGRRRNLFEQLGKEFITGDGDTRDLDLREEVEPGEKLHLEAENNETQYAYHANASVVIDYESGPLGVLKKVFS